jgi:serine/threonine protein phosphatase PrpC
MESLVPYNGTSLPNAMPSQKKTKKPCQDNFTTLSDSEKVLLCLFDGHGPFGEVVTKYLIQICTTFFESVEVEGNPKRYLKQLFKECEAILVEKANKLVMAAGSTFVCVLLYNSCLYAASVGDSRAIAILNTGNIIQLTVD